MGSQKAELRLEMLSRLRSVTAAEREDWSREICRRILLLPAWKTARNVLLYAPLKNEPDILPLFEELERPSASAGPALCFPRIGTAAMDFWRVTEAAHLGAVASKLREPLAEHCAMQILPDEIDLVVLPGLAFDAVSGIRLGRGGGYYDRFLADPNFTGLKLGVCFSFQKLSGLPAEPHDVPVDILITEAEMLRIPEAPR